MLTDDCIKYYLLAAHSSHHCIDCNHSLKVSVKGKLGKLRATITSHKHNEKRITKTFPQTETLHIGAVTSCLKLIACSWNRLINELVAN